jgi:hypothetical protein
MRAAAVLMAIAAASPLAAAPARAAAGATSAICTEQMTATITPGFSTTRSTGPITGAGSILCAGTLNGHRVTGPGRIEFEETYTGTCVSDASTGTVRLTSPTTAGTQHLAGTFVQRRVALAIRVEARFPNARYSAIGLITPRRGNCFLTPLREVAILLTGSLRSS